MSILIKKSTRMKTMYENIYFADSKALYILYASPNVQVATIHMLQGFLGKM